MRRALVTVLVIIAGCSDGPPRPILLVDDPGIARNDPRLAYGAAVTIGTERRRVLAASKPIVTDATLEDAPGGRIKYFRAPAPSLPKGALVVFAAATLEDGVPVPIRVWPLRMHAGEPLKLLVYKATLPPPEKTVVGVTWPVVPLDERDQETGPVSVPPGATLTVGFGLEPACLQMALAPVLLGIVAVDPAGVATTLHEASVSARPAQPQRWLDAAIPLAPLAGRTVRFRFTMRTAVPPQGSYVLPVFAEPTIAVATPGRQEAL
jgi:hypothetical protein